uniref:Uncharacterized protein n=1 Tax=Graphocephala atropunctata TaxID=36148 RepID=A0A1B6L7U3_9HEMI
MKKKYADNSDEENEFEVDEPEEIQNNASDDDWTPDKDTSGGRRTSTRLRNIPKSRAPIIDASSTDEEGSDESQGKRKAGRNRARGRQPVKKHKVSSSSVTTTPTKVNDSKSVSSDSEPTSTTTYSSTVSPNVVKVNKDFTSGAFVVLKSDATNLEADPPLWKIDGKALLQKYIPFQQDGKTLYKNTSVYSGWTINNKDNYFPVSVIFKQQTRKEHIVEFHRDQIKQGDRSGEVTSSSSSEKQVEEEVSSTRDTPKASDTKPVIKVKAFAIVPEEETCTPAKRIDDEDDKTSPSLTLPVIKINKDYASGAFLVLRTEAANVDPPLWKIDGKNLLQKYSAFDQNGKTLYKNTAEYSGWSSTNQSNYFPVSVIFKQQNKKEHIIEVDRIKWDEPEESGKDN